MKKISIIIISLILFTFPSVIFALGDINEDGKINIMDASLIRRYIDNEVDLTDVQVKNADINNDGKVNDLDVFLLRNAISHVFEFDGSSPITNYLYCNGLLINNKEIVIEPNEEILLQLVSLDSAGRIDIKSLDETIATIDKSSFWIENEEIGIKVKGLKSGTTKLKVDVNIATFEEEKVKETLVINIIVKNKVIYKIEGQEFIEYYAPNEKIIFKTDVTKEGYKLLGYKYNNQEYKLDDELLCENSEMELEPVWKVVNPEISEETEYVVDTGYIRNIEINKEAKDLDLKLNDIYTTKVIGKDNNEKTAEFIGTGDKVQIFLNDIKVSEYIVIIKGDVNGDGDISPLDYVKIKNHIMGSPLIEGYEYLDAADYNSDDEISPLDYVKVKNFIMNGDN